MSIESSSSVIENLIKNYSSKDGERLAGLERERQYLARKDELSQLKGHIDKSIAELRGEIKTGQAQSETKTLRLFLGLCVFLVGVVSPIISGLVLNAISKGP